MDYKRSPVECVCLEIRATLHTGLVVLLVYHERMYDARGRSYVFVGIRLLLDKARIPLNQQQGRRSTTGVSKPTANLFSQLQQND